MSVQVDDILKIITTSEMTGAVSKNVYHVKVTQELYAGNVTETMVAKMFHEQIAKRFIDLAVTYMSLLSTKVINLTQPNQPFGEYAYTIAGSQAGDNAPTFVAFSYRQTVSTNLTRGGYKRFMGVSETFMAGNNFTGAFVTSATTAGGYIGGGVQILFYPDDTGDEAIAYRNIILKSSHSNPPISTDYQNVEGVQFINSPTTQNTRKRL